MLMVIEKNMNNIILVLEKSYSGGPLTSKAMIFSPLKKYFIVFFNLTFGFHRFYN